MSWVATKSCVGNIFKVSLSKAYFSNKSTYLLRPPTFSIQTASISGKALRDKKEKRPPPYPYKKKPYRFINALFDRTTWRFNENSKIVVVEGPIAAGKTTFADALAKDLDMLHLCECNMDMMYTTESGFDLRELDSRLPESCRSFDIKNFYENPRHENVARFQIEMYQLRFKQYLEALAHVLNTGQGVVLERCVYSDFVFLETMHKCGYISKGARSVYYDIVNNTLPELMKPHLVIYLDVPVNIVEERIKKRNNPGEVNSKVLTTEYLSTLENFYKQKYLKEISTHAELLVYDWSDFGDVEVVVEDVERIDFDCFGKHDPKMKDWRKADEWAWNEARSLYTNQEPLVYFNVPRFDVPELVISAEDSLIRTQVLDDSPEIKFRPGYNSKMGDKGVLFKW